MISATWAHSVSLKPLVVMAGVPNRIPEGLSGLRGSSAIMFMLSVMPTSSSTVWAFFPPTFIEP